MILCLLSVLGVVGTFQKSKCKKLLETTLERIQILTCKREVQLRNLRGDAAQLLKRGKTEKAQIWLEYLWKELCLLSVYIKIQEYCNKVRINLSNIAGQRECPMDLEEPVASLCFVASCCADLPELHELREIFASKYGTDFVNFAQELKDTSHVNRSILEFLSMKAPPENFKKELKEYVLTQSDMKDRIQKELLEILSRSGGSKADAMNEGRLVVRPSLEVAPYSNDHGLIDGEHTEENAMALVLDHQGMNTPVSNQSAADLRNYSAYDRKPCTYGSQSKLGKLFSRAHKRRTKLEDYGAAFEVQNWNHRGNGEYGDDQHDGDDHSEDHPRLEMDRSSANDDGHWAEEEDHGVKYLVYPCQRRLSDENFGQHLHRYAGECTNMGTAYAFVGNDENNGSTSSCGYPSPSPSPSPSMPPRRAPPPVPPSFPRVSSMPLLAAKSSSGKNGKKHCIPRSSSTTFGDLHTAKPACIPPDFEHVRARVAELSGNGGATLRKESSL